MKKKNITAILALFFGWIGAHRFYLGQYFLGVVYFLLFFLGITQHEENFIMLVMFLSLIDLIVFFAMSQKDFDKKYNKGESSADNYEDYIPQTVPSRKPNKKPYEYAPPKARKKEYVNKNYTRPSSNDSIRKAEQYKIEGIKKFKEFCYEEAVENFEKSLAINDNDPVVHFNLACSYSLLENSEKAFYHLKESVADGFVDLYKIQDHDALAFLRVQPGYEEFKASGFKILPKIAEQKIDEEPKAAQPAQQPVEAKAITEAKPDLLEQIKRLEDLKELGVLSQKDLEEQKRKLLA